MKQKVVLETLPPMLDIQCGGSFIPHTSKEEARAIVEEYNRKLGVTRAQEEAMKGGSMFGFDKPIADPANYDAQGQPLKRREKDRGDTR